MCFAAWPPALRRARTVAGALTIAVLAPTAGHGQEVAGRVVVDATGRPLSGVRVRVVTGTFRRATGPSPAGALDTIPVAQALTGDDGWFAIALPRPGTYHLQVAETLLATALTLTTADSTDAREYRVNATDLLPPGKPVPSDSALDALLRAGVPLTGRQVERVACYRAIPLSRPQPAAEHAELPPTATVTVAFVVDSTGRADLATFRVLEATAPAFANVVRDAVSGAQFRPAELHGRRVPFVGRQFFAFARAGEEAPTSPVPPAVAALSEVSVCR